MTKAIVELRTWRPLSVASPSTAERIVVYHLDVRQAKALRYQGRVSESLEYPQRSLLQSKHEAWFEDARPGLICELGDVYCELGDQLSAERLLEVEIKF